MKTITRTLIAALATTVILGTAATSQAQVNARSLFNQVAKSYSGQANNTFQIRRAVQPTRQAGGNFGGGNQGGRHFGGGHNPGHVLPPPSHCRPKPPCNPGYHCPPPRPCYIYIVYKYCCTYGWQHYGTYHSEHDAHYYVNMLQNQGYRAYMQKTTR